MKLFDLNVSVKDSMLKTTLYLFFIRMEFNFGFYNFKGVKKETKKLNTMSDDVVPKPKKKIRIPNKRNNIFGKKTEDKVEDELDFSDFKL